MKANFAGFGLFACSIFTATVAVAQEMETISRPDIAAANCPAEWAAVTAFDTNLLADSNPIGIDPTLDDATTNAFNKYFLWIMAQAAQVESVISLRDPATHTQSYLNEAKAMLDLSECLTMTEGEQDLIVVAYQAHRPTVSEEQIRTALFEAFDDYACMGFAPASAQIFALDPQSDSFFANYEEIMSSTEKGCG